MGDFMGEATNTNLPREIKKAKEKYQIFKNNSDFRLRKAIGGNKLNKNGNVEYQTNILLKHQQEIIS